MTTKPIDEGRAHDVEGVLERLDDHAPLAEDRTLLSDSVSLIRSLQEQLEKMERETVSRISGWVDSYSKAHQRALAAEAEVSSLRDRVAELERVNSGLHDEVQFMRKAAKEKREGAGVTVRDFRTARAVKGGRDGE